MTTLAGDSVAEPARSAKMGEYVGMGSAWLMGALLAVAARGNTALLLCVLMTTFMVAQGARRVGRSAGPHIARRSLLPALGIGALSGLICLGYAAVCAGVLGLIWAGYDGFSDPHLLHNYLRKPVLAVLGYGFMPALLLGIVAGSLLFALTRPRKKPIDSE